MTREEHISNLETIGCDGWTVTTEAYKSLQFAIKVLKKEPILDKIRAEVIEKAKCTMNDTRAEGLYMALQIIDKYRGESDCRECKVEHDCYECEKYAESEDK